MKLLLVLFTILSFSPAQAALKPVRCGLVVTSCQRSDCAAPRSQISVEWNTQAHVFRPYLTPRNGRVGGLLPHAKSPPWLDEWWNSPQSAASRARYPRVPRPRELPWAAFPADLQDRLITYSAQEEVKPLGPELQGANAFGFSREIGIEKLVLRGQMPVLVHETQSAFGRVLSPGRQLIDLGRLGESKEYEYFTVLNDMNVLEPMQSLTGTVEPGTHTLLAVAVGRSGAVEHTNPENLAAVLAGEALGQVQLHLRSQMGEMSASDMLRGVNLIAASAGLSRPQLHMHLVDDLPAAVVAHGTPAQQLAQVLSMVDLAMRANELEEYRAILEGYPLILRRSVEAHTSYWAVLEAHHFATLSNRFIRMLFPADVSLQEFPYLGNELKGGFVGIHWSAYVPEKYDRIGSWGFHVRGIDGGSQPEVHYAILDSFQNRLALNDYVHSWDRIGNWLQRSQMAYQGFLNQDDFAAVGQKFAHARWNKPWEVLFTNATLPLQGLLDPRFKSYLEALNEFKPDAQNAYETATHLEVKLLLHDFSRQLNYFDKPGRVAEIQRLQIRALQRLRKVAHGESDESPLAIVQSFVHHAKLFEDAAAGFGLKIDLRVAPPAL